MRATRWRVALAWTLSVLIAVAATGFASYLVLTPTIAASDSAEAPMATYEAMAGELSNTTSLQGSVEFLPGPPGLAAIGGTITSVNIDPEIPLEVGKTALTIDLRPMVAALGTVPAFRTLDLGTRGPDVRQLRQFLGLESSDYFDWNTYTAVAAWQDSLGMKADGIVQLGDIVFLPALPTRVSLPNDISIGSRVESGEQILITYKPLPRVSVTASGNGPTVEAGMSASFAVGGATFRGIISAPFTQGDGLVAFEVLGQDGEAVCDADCAAKFSIDATSSVPVLVELTPSLEGVIIPASAVAVGPDGSTFVMLPDGGRIPIVIELQARGLAVVKGLRAGTTVALFAETGE